MQKKIDYRKQNGAVLIVGLIMMLLITIIGLASIGDSELQERMSGNMRNLNLAFQSAEAGLRIGENAAINGALPARGTAGHFEDLNLSTATLPRPVDWNLDQWGTNALQVTTSDFASDLPDNPRYVVEFVEEKQMGGDSGSGVDFVSAAGMPPLEYYRVTSRATGSTANAEVILQATLVR